MCQRRRPARDGRDDPTRAERAAPLSITEDTGLGSLAASRHAALLKDDNARAAHSAGRWSDGNDPFPARSVSMPHERLGPPESLLERRTSAVVAGRAR